MSEASGYEYGVGEAAAALGLALDVIPWRRMAGHYHRRALAVAQDVANPVLRGFANLAGAFHAYLDGRLEEALEYAAKSAGQYQAGGEIRGWASASQLVAWVLRLQGRFAASLDQSNAIVRVANDAGDTQGVAFALHGAGWTSWHLGNLGEAEAHLTQSIELYASLPNDQARAEALADLAMCRLRQDRLAEALRLAEDSTRIIDSARLRGFYVTRPRLALAEITLAAVPSCTGRARARMLARARRACRAGFHQARVDASALPAAQRMWGTYLWLRGRSRRARRSWTKALATGEALGLPFEVGLTWLELGARLDDPAASRRGREALERIQARS
jgi:tetratricopeptide (TPR) repeat protein